MFKPLLAATVTDLEATLTLHGPMLASPKFDGVRCLTRNGLAVSRNLKSLPNQHIQSMMSMLPDGLDGELVVGDATDPKCFQTSQSAIMRHDGKPVFTYFVFDYVTEPLSPFNRRLPLATALARGQRAKWVQTVNHEQVWTPDDVLAYETKQLLIGYEGVMLRRMDGPYKHGRSTLKEGILLKLKRFVDSEAVVIGLTEAMHNANEQTKDELGRSKRSSHQANKVGKAMLGSLVVKDLKTNVEFEVGTGFTEQQRIDIWEAPHDIGGFIGQVLTYKSQPTGVKDKPRFPVFKGWRHAVDC